jgi:hypothetical protein
MSRDEALRVAYAEHYPEHVVTATGPHAVSEEVGFLKPPSDDVENQAGNSPRADGGNPQ